MINKVILVGNLGSDPKTHEFSNGNMVANFTLATKERYTDRNGERIESTEWHNISCFGKTADLAAQYLSKGSKVYLEGKIKTSKYESAEGEERYKTEIIANNISFLSSKNKNEEEEVPFA